MRILATGLLALVSWLCVAEPSRSYPPADHLAPEDSVFSREWDDGYHAMVLSVLSGAYARHVRARVLVMPSFQNEYAVALTENLGAYSIIYLEPEVQIWQYKILEYLKSGEIRSRSLSGESRNEKEIAELEARLPAHLNDVVVSKCERRIDAALGELLAKAWEAMLLQTRFREVPMIGVDGTTYHFSGGHMAGQTWTPDEDTLPGRLAAISELMKAACLSRDQQTLSDLREDVQSLLRDVQPGIKTFSRVTTPRA